MERFKNQAQGKSKSKDTRVAGRTGGLPSKRSDFKSSRLEEAGGDLVTGPYDVADTDKAETEDLDVSSSEEDVPPSKSYTVLLQALNAGQESKEPARKKRKTSDPNTDGGPEDLGAAEALSTLSNTASEAQEEYVKPDDVEDQTELEEAQDDLLEGGDSEVESEGEEGLKDPFVVHFANPDEASLAKSLEMAKEKKWNSNSSVISGDIRKTTITLTEDSTQSAVVRSLKDMSLKARLLSPGSSVTTSLNDSEMDVASSVFNYQDIQLGSRSLANASRLRGLVSLHALNHIFKTRDRVIKNNSKLAQLQGGDPPDLRDQGFTRPKVLFLVPTRQSCVRVVDSLVRLSEPEQQENKTRFSENFGGEDEKTWDDKPEDFRDLFGGNDDDMFRIGLKFTRKTIKFFSAFYNSDIILASPLGLRRAIEGSDSKDKKKAHDADFLSSIEIAIVDHANALLMQNWQHVDYIFSQLNQLPKESHGCDFSRVRNWYLDGHAKYLRQTIILSDYLTPEINSLATTHMFNFAGRVKYIPIYRGAMLELPYDIPLGLRQTFSRFDSPSLQTDDDARFQHFTSTILPTLLRDRHDQKGTLVFTPTYLDFVRLRNHLSTSPETTSLSFGSISEYTSVRDVARTRSHFLTGRYGLLLFTERAHHFRRYRLKGVRRLLFYGVPENPRFWSEIVGFLSSDPIVSEDVPDPEPPSDRANDRRRSSSQQQQQAGVVRAIFSKWDAMKLERIVGSDRIGRLVSDKAGDTFDFVS